MTLRDVQTLTQEVRVAKHEPQQLCMTNIKADAAEHLADQTKQPKLDFSTDVA